MPIGQMVRSVGRSASSRYWMATLRLSRMALRYNINIVGFGWTNGVFLVLVHELPEASVAKLAREQAAAPGSGH